MTAKRSAAGWSRTNDYGDSVKRGGKVRNEYSDEPDPPGTDYGVYVLEQTPGTRSGAGLRAQKKKKYTVEGRMEWSYYFDSLEDFIAQQSKGSSYVAGRIHFPSTEGKVLNAVAKFFNADPAEVRAQINAEKSKQRSAARIR